jgi:uncharacterized protein YyaL (SSP411 family)/thiol-disulfide isomerase/thioredoxin
MERESFEDEAIAALMNADFVCVKVDREERPDLDELYMSAVQAFTGGHGGWPMTVFLSPEGRPFFGGTYFPPTSRPGVPSFPQVLAHAARLWREERPKVEKVGADLVQHIHRATRMPAPAPSLGEDWLGRILLGLADDFDRKEGGFGARPKFPPHGSLAALLAHSHRSGDREAAEMLRRTLEGMAKGGMYDLLGGGFARYSVDERWLIPHFEKMLYDNAQLLPLYVEAWQQSTAEQAEGALYRRVAVETAEYVLREMTHPEGGFCAAQDADSEGVEGRYFAWTPRELRSVLGFFDGPRVAVLLGVTDEGSFEHGTSVLRLDTPREALTPEDQALLARALPLLKAVRDARVAPSRDDKVVTAWSALMVSALCRAGAAFEEPRYIEAAAKAARFLDTALRVNGRLQRTWKEGRAHTPAFADDSAALIGAFLDLHQATGEGHWLDRALAQAEETLRLYWDDQDGGLWYTGHDAEGLVARSKHLIGGAEPAANGQAALHLARLARLCDREDLGQKADRILRSYQAILDRAPRAIGLEAVAAAWRTGPTQTLALIGPAEGRRALRAALARRHAPFLVVVEVEADAVEAATARHPWLAGQRALDGVATAWLCEGGACRLPVTTAEALGAELDRVLRPARAGRAPAGRPRAPGLPEAPAAWLNSPAPLTLEGLRGKVVVLDFWTSCCINCLHVLPELDRLERRFEGKPVVVIGVHSSKFTAEKDRANLARSLERLGVHHPVIHDPDHAVWDAWGVRSWPTLVVLDAEGHIASKQPGETDADTLSAIVERLLEEAGVAVVAEPTPQAAPRVAPPVTTVTTAPSATLRFPGKVAVWPGTGAQERGDDPFGPHARLYISDTGHHRVLECRLSKGIEGWPRAELLRSWGGPEAGFTDGPRRDARLRAPQGLDRSGSQLWVADTGNHALRRIELDSGRIETLAGNGALDRGQGPDSLDAREAPMRSPWDVAVAGPDNGGSPAGKEAVFVAMAGAHQIWIYMAENGGFGPFAGSGREEHEDGALPSAAFAQPSGLGLFGRYLFVADAEISSVRAIDLQQGKVGTIVGRGLFDFGDQDGAPREVRLQHPEAVAAFRGTLYVADTYNNKVKTIQMNGAETHTLVGGDPAVLHAPGGIAVAGDYLLVADTNNHRVRVIRRKDGAIRDLPLA